MSPTDTFIIRWTPSGDSELGSSQSFLNELCDLMETRRPDVPRPELVDNSYVFEKAVTLISPESVRVS